MVFTIITITSSCNQKPETLTKKRVTIKYTNGKIYCDGFHSINFAGVVKNRVGIWKFFYPNGTLETFSQYNEEGEIINQKEYSEMVK